MKSEFDDLLDDFAPILGDWGDEEMDSDDISFIEGEMDDTDCNDSVDYAD